MKLIRSAKPVAKVINQKDKKSTLPPDTYKDEIEPVHLHVDDSRELVISVQRGGEEGLPQVDIRTYQTTEAYTGFTKKGINIPLNLLPDIMDILSSTYKTCDKKGLVSEYEE